MSMNVYMSTQRSELGRSRRKKIIYVINNSYINKGGVRGGGGKTQNIKLETKKKFNYN